MSDRAMTEVPLQFGEGGRLFGILTVSDVQSSDLPKPPAFVFLTAGLLHRVGPHRMYVRLARELAQIGINSLRVDLAGIGDSPPCPDLTYQQSVAADYVEISSVLESQLGPAPIVLAGLCSGADNVIRLSISDPRVVGMVLLDPVCCKDDGFRKRAVVFSAKAFARKSMEPARYLPWLKRRIGARALLSNDTEIQIDNLTLRVSPTQEQMRAAFESVRERDGRVLSVFTEYALRYYNHIGQMGRVLGVEGYEQYCTEIFWPHVEHSYPLESHRRRLIDEIISWAAQPMPKLSI